MRAQQAEEAGKSYTWLPEFDQLTLGLREHHDESYNDRVLPCTAAFALHLGRTFKPRTTYGAEAFTTILAFVQKELRGVKVQNDTFTRLLAFNSFAIFQVNEAGLPNAYVSDCRTHRTQGFKSSYELCLVLASVRLLRTHQLQEKD